MPDLGQIIGDLTVTSIVSDAIRTVILMVICRFALWLFNLPPKSERLYWLLGIPAFVLLLSMARAIGPESRPNMRAAIEATHFAETVIEGGGKLSAIWIIASVSNSGAPSAAGPYDIELHLPERPGVIKGHRLAITEDTRIIYQGRITEYVYAADALSEKTSGPIDRGGKIYGRLLFSFPGVRPEDLRILGAKYVLTFPDVWGVPYSAEYVISERIQEPIEYPGMRPRFTKPGQPDIQPAPPPGP